jgi:FkbM family methyltransferase
MAAAAPQVVGGHSSGDEEVGLASGRPETVSYPGDDFLECKLRMSRGEGKLCLGLTLALSLSFLILVSLVWYGLAHVPLAPGGHPVHIPTADKVSPQGWHCPQGTLATDQPVDISLQNDKKVATHTNGLTFRTAVFTDNSQGPRSAEFAKDKIARIQRGVWEDDQDPYMTAAFNGDPNCEYPIFIDGGAAFGFYSLLAQRLQSCRKVHAFNPHPRFAFAMGLNLQDNDAGGRINSDSACINRKALAKANGNVQFNFGYGGGIGVGDKSKAVTVPMVNLDSFFDDNVPPDMRVIMVKLDVEGQELEVMKGATKLLKGCRVKHWAIGIHKDHLLDPVKEILLQSGYTIDRANKMVAGQPNGEVLAHC